jgi:hypothetical protein
MFWLLEGGLVFFAPYSGSHVQVVRTAFIPACCTVYPKHVQAQDKIVAERKKFRKRRLLQLTNYVDLNVFGPGSPFVCVKVSK